MSLMISARWRASRHMLTGWRLLSPDHGINRIYSHFGFCTRAVFCDCGEVFGNDGTYNIGPIIDAMRYERRLRRVLRR